MRAGPLHRLGVTVSVQNYRWNAHLGQKLRYLQCLTYSYGLCLFKHGTLFKKRKVPSSFLFCDYIYFYLQSRIRRSHMTWNIFQL